MMLTADEVDEEFVKKAKIFHFGTLSMTHDGVREATKKALKIAKDNGLVITFDPNLRPPLWSSLELAKEQMEYGFAYCDVLKISDNEIQFISGKRITMRNPVSAGEISDPAHSSDYGERWKSCLLQRYESGSCRTRCEGNRDDRCRRYFLWKLDQLCIRTWT